MKPVYILVEAERELEAIFDYIAENGGPKIALRFVGKIRREISSIGEMPKAGQLREDLLPGVRQRTIGRYLVFYQETAEAIIVLHVVHGMRHLPSALGQEPFVDSEDV